jgi:hypothetical protein
MKEIKFVRHFEKVPNKTEFNLLMRVCKIIDNLQDLRDDE